MLHHALTLTALLAATATSVVAGLRLADAPAPRPTAIVEPPGAAPRAGRCTAEGPEYYAFPLVTTRNVPGTGLATGTAEVSFSPGSPFSVSVGADGSYAYELGISLERMRPPAYGRLVAWVTTPDLSDVRRVGPLDELLRADGHVSWNKFLVVITLEAADDPAATRWNGPVVFRGMSRSGMMHTMVGHGLFQKENCAAYGY